MSLLKKTTLRYSYYSDLFKIQQTILNLIEYARSEYEGRQMDRNVAYSEAKKLVFHQKMSMLKNLSIVAWVARGGEEMKARSAILDHIIDVFKQTKIAQELEEAAKTIRDQLLK